MAMTPIREASYTVSQLTVLHEKDRATGLITCKCKLNSKPTNQLVGRSNLFGFSERRKTQAVLVGLIETISNHDGDPEDNA